jgi:hypothetical protein
VGCSSSLLSGCVGRAIGSRLGAVHPRRPSVLVTRYSTIYAIIGFFEKAEVSGYCTEP